jgi:hypothetical protein
LEYTVVMITHTSLSLNQNDDIFLVMIQQLNNIVIKLIIRY